MVHLLIFHFLSLYFFLIALTLFCIIKFINKVRADADALKEKMAKEEKEVEGK